jgi:hypothetical protein
MAGKRESIKQFIFSKLFVKQLKYALAVFFGIILLTSICLNIFTLHNRTIEVPDFKGLTLTEATEMADDNNMRCDVIDSVYVFHQKPGTIVEQIPEKGINVKRGRRILLVMNAMSPEKVEMPNLVGVSLRQAMSIIESNGLIIGTFKYVPDIANNNVLKQRYKGKDIKPGVKIKKGSRIDLVLGRAGGGGSTKVPDLSGLELNTAKKILADSYLNTGKVNYDNSVVTYADTITAVVHKQKPAASDNAYSSMGAFVDVWLSNPDKNNKQTEEEDTNE